MPSYFIKPQLDVDQYVWWSSVVDGPLMWGTREEFTNLYEDKREYMFEFGENFEERLNRADETGSSSFFYTRDEDIMYAGYGTLQWSKIPELLKVWETDMSMELTDPRLLELVDEHDWDDEE